MQFVKALASGFAVFVVVILLGGAAFEDGQIFGAFMIGTLTFVVLMFIND